MFLLIPKKGDLYMFKSAMMVAMMIFGLHSQADINTTATVKAVSQVAIQDFRPFALLNWNVGAYADYNINGGFISGTMHSVVREETDMGYWIQQDMDMGFLGKNKVEIHINKETGEIIELLVNGNKETPPDPNNTEITESMRTEVTVPKGTFECIYAKLRDKEKNEITEIWVNPTIVPMGGMLKTVAPSPLGPLTVELTDYKI
jgi:hypothetical protein